MLSEGRAQTLLDRVLKLSPARATEVIVKYRDMALTRFANNTITQNVSERDTKISIRVLHDDKMGRAETNRTDTESIVSCCERALQLAKNSARDPNTIPLPGRQTYYPVHSFHNCTREFGPEKRAAQVMEVIAQGEEKQAKLAGMSKIVTSATAIKNSQGLFAYAQATEAILGVTACRNDHSGMAVTNEADVEQIEAWAVAERAIGKAVQPYSPRAIEPGEYTVILEPLAVLNLLSLLVVDYISHVSHFSGTAVSKGQGFVCGHLGDKMFGEKLTLDDDVYHPRLQGTPFDGEGMPTMPVILVYNGILTQLVHSRTSALKMGCEPTGHALELPNPYGAVPQHLVMHGADTSLDEMIRKTDRGLYITRFWYNRLVDPSTLLVTGMTRDGTFLIENGEIVAGVKNLRFNQNLIEVFKRITDLGNAERTYDDENGQLMVVPPIRVEGFRFTGMSNL